MLAPAAVIDPAHAADGLATLDSLATAIVRLRNDLARTEKEFAVARSHFERLLVTRLVAPSSDWMTDLDRLTARERQVAILAAAGKTNAAMAAHLSVSTHTVKTQMRSVLRKLGLRSRLQLFRAGTPPIGPAGSSDPSHCWRSDCRCSGYR